MNRWPSVFRFGQEAGAEDTEKQSTVKKSSHLTESSKTTTTTTTTSSQQTFRPVNLVNIPLPTTGGHVTVFQTPPVDINININIKIKTTLVDGRS
uniref:Uncharacterized protein n=1 Tax=Timema tahoe TaxID=61484 RepID=A0A7R9IK22_9NEOP|nr:unnamed protein product [Timema tahoe]